MGDAQSLLRAKGIQPVVIERTEPKHGEFYFAGHRVVRMGDPLPIVVPTQDYHADPHLAVQRRLPWWVYALIGAGMALVVLLARGW